MSEHESIRALLALAAAGTLDEPERRRVEAHVSRCEACRTELAAYEALAAALRCAPTPHPRPELVERVNELALARLAARPAPPEPLPLIPVLVLASWIAVLAAWPLLGAVAGGVLNWLNLPSAGAWKWAINFALSAATLAAWGMMALALRVRLQRSEK
jgi:anti-sigma factor RsiW